jgi:tetratricopeptide (TPR) repeat protein
MTGDFRDRPVNQQWQESVFSLLGRFCIRCENSENIRAHHIRPVALFPELAFSPHNGVPLCDKCDANWNGVDRDLVEKIVQIGEAYGSSDLLQVAHNVLEQFKVDVLKTIPDRETLRQIAEALPSNTDFVTAWFCRLQPPDGTDLDNRTSEQTKEDARELKSFYVAHRAEFGESAYIYICLANALIKLEHKPETILNVLERCHRSAERQWADGQNANSLEHCIELLTPLKVDILCRLGRTKDALAFVNSLVIQFPENRKLRQELANLHRLLASQLAEEGTASNDEYLSHVMKYIELRPDFAPALCFAAAVLARGDRFDDAFRHATRALEVSASDGETTEALRTFSCVYCSMNRDEEALPYLHKALEIDACDPETLSILAQMNHKLGHTPEAIHFARQCLLYEPEHEVCKSLVSRLENNA